ncbi:hypothetical protein LR48_Vigan04g137300 [Vigna angularis]|uniref:Uncharacterized protein n=2 Tax=Phaseolus angularis TaxID=3914 RepID=A0A0L9UE10_PHAAN|nr:hypothetical protein LR48_Vigan04g137300 [Vigna angularis]BAT79223.1 hypothetical protein VIGAN_02206500 [Vigna angularis var. angularis]
MSGSGKKRSSKWDFRVDPEFSPDVSKQLRPGCSSADVAGNNSLKWSYFEGSDKLKPDIGFSSKEPFFGGRGSHKDDVMNKDYGCLDATMEWDEDGYNKKISLGYEEWKPKRQSIS